MSLRYSAPPPAPAKPRRRFWTIEKQVLAGIVLVTAALYVLTSNPFRNQAVAPVDPLQQFAGAAPSPGNPPALPSGFENSAGLKAAANDAFRIVGKGCPGRNFNYGSGWPISSTNVVTNAHVVGGTTAIEVQAPNQPTRIGRVVFFDAAHDLAVLHVDGANYQPLLISHTDLPEGTRGVIFAYFGAQPESVVSFVTNGYIVAPAVYNGGKTILTLEFSALVEKGYSGAALVDSRGVVIGIVYEAKGGMSWAIAPSIAYQELNAVAHATKPVADGTCAG